MQVWYQQAIEMVVGTHATRCLDYGYVTCVTSIYGIWYSFFPQQIATRGLRYSHSRTRHTRTYASQPLASHHIATHHINYHHMITRLQLIPVTDPSVQVTPYQVQTDSAPSHLRARSPTHYPCHAVRPMGRTPRAGTRRPSGIAPPREPQGAPKVCNPVRVVATDARHYSASKHTTQKETDTKHFRDSV